MSTSDVSLLSMACRKCGAEVIWGGEACPKCGTAVVNGWPPILDKPIGFIVHLLVVFILFLIVSAVCAAIHITLPIPIRLGIAALIVCLKLGVTMDMGIYPKAARLKLVAKSDGKPEGGSPEKPFDLAVTPQDWANPEASLNPEVLKRGLLNTELARLAPYLSPTTADHVLSELASSTSIVVREAALSAMTVVRRQTLRSKMEMLVKDSGIAKKVRKQAEEVLTTMATTEK